MPLNVRRFFASFLLSLLAITFVSAQTAPVSTTTTAATTTPSAPTTADVMRQRISKAKAFIVVKNYNAAIYELENIRRETNDSNIHAMLNVLLMHSYLEQTDYKRAQEFLDGLYKDLKSKKPNAEMNYYAAAGQVIKGARNQIDRYKSVGLTVSDRNLPLEALVDIDKMRETLETVITQSKDLGADKKQTPTALPLLEEAINARSSLAKDDYDANRWKLEVADAREGLVTSRSTIINAVDGTSETVPQTSVPQNTVAANTSNTNPTVSSNPPVQTVTQTPAVVKTPDNVPSFQPVQTSVEKPNTVQPNTETTNQTVANTEQRPNNQRQRLIVGQGSQPAPNSVKQQETKPETTNQTVAASTETVPNDGSPLTVGSLVEYATKRVNPVYPAQARTMRMTGVVKVKVTIDETGKVAQVEDADGPSLLQRSAEDAVKKWQFKPFVRNGQPTKATGFVNFNFTL